MPILALCEIMVQAYFAVHAIRTGRERQWLFVIIIFPGVGSLIYFFSEYLPEMQHAAQLRKKRPQVNSSKYLRYLEDQVEITPSVKNKKTALSATTLQSASTHSSSQAPPPAVQLQRQHLIRLGGTPLHPHPLLALLSLKGEAGNP